MKHTIYKIYSDSCDYVYVGSTKAYASRKAQHKMCCNKVTRPNHNLKVYTTIRANGGWDAFKMVPIEEFECDTKLQAHIREQHWIDTLQSNMNSRGCIFNKQSKNDYYAVNIDRISEYNREYYKKRKEASQITNE